jgi:hypothetical protein
MILPGLVTTGAKSADASGWVRPTASRARASASGPDARSAPTSANPVSTSVSPSTRTARVPPPVLIVATFTRTIVLARAALSAGGASAGEGDRGRWHAASHVAS